MYSANTQVIKNQFAYKKKTRVIDIIMTDIISINCVGVGG